MKFNFKKVASVLASAVMLTSTIGFAAAANYPAPFSSAGGAVVYGANAAKSDVIAAIKVAESIKTTTSTTTVATGCTGDCGALFTGSSKINANDTMAQVKSVLTATELPTVLKKGSFSGNVDATYTQTIDLGPTTNLNSPTLVFAKQPTSSNDPAYGFSESTQTTNYIYNASITFNKAVNFTDANSKNQEITFFGQKYTIGSGTDATNLILFKSATKLYFDSGGTTSQEVTVEGKKYTIEMVSASTTTATISVTDEAGVSEQKEVTEGYSKKINGITIAVNTADSNNLKYTASVVAGADKITLTSANAVTTGDEATTIDGTYVSFTNNCTSMTKIVISVAAKTSDVDALMPGQVFTDPVFKSFKVDFSAGLNIPETTNTTTVDKREDIVIKPAGDDKLTVKFTNNRGNSATVQYAKNFTSTGMQLQRDDSGSNITVYEGGTIFRNEYVVVGNEDQGYLLRVSTISNNSDGYSSDKVELTDVFDTSSVFTATISAEGSGTVTIGGKVYNLNYYATPSSGSSDGFNITLNYPDSAGTVKVAYPTMQSSLGAKIAFYKPLVIDMDAVRGLKVPNGNGYTSIDWVPVNTTSPAGMWNFTSGSPTAVLSNTTGGINVTVGQFTYAFNATVAQTGGNLTTFKIIEPSGSAVDDPAVIIIEEKDDASAYQGMIVTTESGTTSTDGIGVTDVARTWSADTQWDAQNLASNSNKAKDADLFGTTALVDSTDSDQKFATISYPDEQIWAQLYVTGSDVVITPGATTGGATAGLISVEDSAVDSVSGSNLIVVGGSCVNKAAAKILGSEDPICGADFTDKTQVGTGQYIIKTVASPYNADKIAMLVAGYEAVDTINAVDKLLTGVVTDKDTSQVYPITTTA